MALPSVRQGTAPELGKFWKTRLFRSHIPEISGVAEMTVMDHATIIAAVAALLAASAALLREIRVWCRWRSARRLPQT
jgi:hypothetical protein